MAQGTLKISSNFGNAYEAARARLKNNPFFVEQDWIKIAQGNAQVDLDMYIAALDNADKITDLDKFYKDYNYEYADADTRIAALNNELYADRTTLKKRKRPVLNEVGAAMLGSDGNVIEEDYEITDYDYYRDLLKKHNDANYNDFLTQQEQERKDNMNGFVRDVLAPLAADVFELGAGIMDIVDGVIGLTSGVAEGVGASFRNESFSDAFVKANNENRIFDEAIQWIDDFESRYTNMRDLNGEYTNVGKYTAQVARTVGQMLPSIAISYATAGIGGAIGGAVGKAVSTAGSITSQIVYYGAMSTNNVRDMYKEFAFKGVSMPTAQIMSNAALKSTFEFGIEKLLGKILGGSALDNIVFGREVGESAGDTLLSSSIKRILKDAGQESLEEVLQETSGFIVDKAFTNIVNENFGEITELTWENLLNAALIGGIVSFGGSSLNVLRSSGKDFEGNVISRKLKAYEYGLNLSSFVKNYDTVIKAMDKNFEMSKTLYSQLSNNSKIQKQNSLASAAFTEMYAAYRMLTSIYGEIGAEKFNAANKILDKVTADLNAGKYNWAETQKAATAIYNTIKNKTIALEYALDISAKESEKEAEEKEAIRQAEMTGLTERAIVGNEDISSEVEQDELLQAMLKVKDSLEDIDGVYLTVDGNNVVRIGNNILIPERLLKNAGPDVVLCTIAEQEIVNKIKTESTSIFKIALNTVESTFKELTGRTDATLDDVIYSLVFDENAGLYKAMLAMGNKDTYHLLEGLLSYITSVKDNTLSDKVLKTKLGKICKVMQESIVEHLKIQPNDDANLDLLTDNQRKIIAKNRWSSDLYTAVVLGTKLTVEQETILKNRLTYMNIPKSNKDTIWDNLRSSNSTLRVNAINIINNYYDNAFTHNYDGITYMPETSVPNICFNNFLQKLGLTLKTYLSVDSVSEQDAIRMQNEYKIVSADKMLQFRQLQFSEHCNGMYVLDVSSKGITKIVTSKEHKSVGYSLFSESVNSIVNSNGNYIDELGKKKLIDRKLLLRASKRNAVVKALLSKDISELTANMVSINDVIKDSSLLDKSIIDGIRRDYKAVTPETTFLYLRDFITQNDNNLSIVTLPSGDYAFVDLKDMKSILKKSAKTITEDTKVSDLVKASYLTGSLADLKIVLTDEPIRAEFRPYRSATVSDKQGKTVKANDIAIYINKDFANQGGAELEFAFLHEFQHALAFDNKMNMGFDWRWMDSVKDTIKNKIIADVRKNMPHLFKRGLSKEQVEEIVSRFVYFSTGEAEAYGVYSSRFVDFYPTIVNYTNSGTEITFPWGSKFLIDTFKSQLADISSVYERTLVEKTLDYTVDKFKSEPRSCFILNDGSIRALPNDKHHYDIISTDYSLLRSKSYIKFFDSMPQISVQTNNGNYYVSVRVPTYMSHNSENIMLLLMDMLYSKRIAFDIGPIFDSSNINNILIKSSEADTSDDLLKLYNRAVNIAKFNSEREYSLGAQYIKSSFATIDDETESVKKPKRYVSQKEAQETNLRYFVNEYDKTQLSPELQQFIILADGDNSVVEELQERINGNKAGTLTRQHIFDYLQNTDLDAMDVKTFKLINKCFFKNDVIKTPKDLQKYIKVVDKYFAIGSMLQKNPLTEFLFEDTDPDIAFARFEAVDSLPEGNETKQKYISLLFGFNYYDFYNYKPARIVNGRFYDSKLPQIPLDIDVKSMRITWLRNFDGSIASGLKVANIVKSVARAEYELSQKGKGDVSLDSTVEDKEGNTTNLYNTLTEDKEVESTIVRNITELAQGIDYEQMENELIDSITTTAALLIRSKYEGDYKKTKSEFVKYSKLIKSLSEDELTELYVTKLFAEICGVSVDAILKNNTVQETINKSIRTPWSINNNIKSNVRSIKTVLSRLTPKATKNFLEDPLAQKYFNPDLTLKEGVTTNTEYSKNEHKEIRRYKDLPELLQVWEDMKTLLRNVRKDVYTNKKNYENYVKTMEQFREQNDELVEHYRKIKAGKPVKTVKQIVTVEVPTEPREPAKFDVISFDTGKKIPDKLTKILTFEFSEQRKSKVKYFASKDSTYTSTNLQTFLEANAEELQTMTQSDVTEIIEFYLNTVLAKSTMSEVQRRTYNAVQEFLGCYIIEKVEDGQYTMDRELLDKFNDHMSELASFAGQTLANRKSTLRKLNSTERIAMSISKSYGLTPSIESLREMTLSIQVGDRKRIQAAKKKMYDSMISSYKGNKAGLMDKILQWQRIMMLSSPGTWVRNKISNVSIGGLDWDTGPIVLKPIVIKGKTIFKGRTYKGFRLKSKKTGKAVHTPGLLETSEFLGDKTFSAVSKLINKVFPKKQFRFKEIEGQYKISGTVVTQEVKDFIDTYLLKNGLLDEIREGLSKYDMRHVHDKTGSETLSEMIGRSIATEIFYNNQSDNKFVNSIYNFVYKAISDDTAVTKTMLRYLGKMLTEDSAAMIAKNPNIGYFRHGIDEKVTKVIADAYRMAAMDYMRKPNFFTKLEGDMFKNSPKGLYFAYKQIFPFMGASYNWFVEGLKYNPVGLLHSCISYSKLETTIEKLQNAELAGEPVMSHRFAQYAAKRDIGKGIIGTIGYGIGALLVAFGVVKLNEEDDKYQISIGNTYIDITDIFGTQGIFLGMSVTQAAVDKFKNDKDFEWIDVMDIFTQSLNAMFLDSSLSTLYDTFRYSSSVGDMVASIPLRTIDASLPNFVTTISSVFKKYDIKLHKGTLGRIEKMGVELVPFLDRWLPHQVDIYTGESQIPYNAWFLTNLVDKLTPLHIKSYNVTDMEKTSISLGVKKSMLTGEYKINDKKVKLDPGEIETLNKYYGALNKEGLEDLTSNKFKVKVKNKDGTYSEMLYKNMTDEQKGAAIEQVMSKNSTYAKIYILTSKGYKYYASSSEYKELRNLGISNVYKSTSSKKGFVES